ncbi:SAM-dependent methyltransferase [Pleomorphovibrio marinus]|uniref:SAM-dependent methyltransferase n=1 Tax=Pleomorphovibrio marinus TaxID=2164132 RepID=UPI000E0B427C|nr:SAM-dependent methyltransferase [Pleomorphovibrio marinus]
MQSTGKLYLIPNILAAETAGFVIAPQVKEIISATSYYLVENLRTARRYISSLKLGLDISNLHFEILDKRTSDAEIATLASPLLSGHDMGVLSEAGCPGIADPGAKAVAFAHKKNIQVVPLSGPSSLFLALMASGFNGQSFVFHGYLPIERKERVNAMKQLEQNLTKEGSTQMFMETPFRNQRLLEDILLHLHPSTLLCIAKNLTAADEMVQTKSIADWKKLPPDLHKIPTVFLLGRY